MVVPRDKPQGMDTKSPQELVSTTFGRNTTPRSKKARNLLATTSLDYFQQKTKTARPTSPSLDDALLAKSCPQAVMTSQMPATFLPR